MESIFDEFDDVFEIFQRIDANYEHKFVDKLYINRINSLLTNRFFEKDQCLKEKIFWSLITYKGEEKQIISDFSPNILNDRYYGKIFTLIPEWLLNKIDLYKATSITDVLLDKEFNIKQQSITFTSLELENAYGRYILGNRKAQILNTLKKIEEFKGGDTTPIFNALDKISEDLGNVDLGITLGHLFKKTEIYKRLNYFFFSYFLTSIRENSIYRKSIEVEKTCYFCLFPRSHMTDKFKGIYIASFKNIGEKEIEILNKKFGKIKQLLYYLLSIDFSKKIKIDNRIIRHQSLKSAISAIMSRNMSHNIGSHVLADLVSKGKNDTTGDELNHFYRYLQNRMDFIAQITTEFPQWTYPAYFNSELMRIFYENYLLLDRIAVSEGLSAYQWPGNQEWQKGYMRGKIIVRTCAATWKKKETREKAPDKWIINEFKMGNFNEDLQLAIPGGVVGYHAFYTIIENVIRNSAKHGYATRKIFKNNSDDSNKAIIFVTKAQNDKCAARILYKDPKDNKFEEFLKLNGTNIFCNCRTMVIESDCLDIFKPEAGSGIKFIKDKIDEKRNGKRLAKGKITLDGIAYDILDLNRLYIACSQDPGNCNFKKKKNSAAGKSGNSQDSTCDCYFADNDIWKRDTLHYHLLTKIEWDELLGILELCKNGGSDKGIHRYNQIVDFLQKGSLRINIRVDDLEDKDYVWVTVWDDMPHTAMVSFEKSADKDKNDRNHEVSGRMSKFKEEEEKRKNKNKNAHGSSTESKINLFGKMNDMLRESFVKETGELKKENWGIAELKICAGYLQNRRIEEIGGEGQCIIQYGLDCYNIDNIEFLVDDETNANYGYPKMLIKALPVDKTGQMFHVNEKVKLGKGDVYYLGYRFWMKKPKNIAVSGIDCDEGATGNGS